MAIILLDPVFMAWISLTALGALAVMPESPVRESVVKLWNFIQRRKLEVRRLKKEHEEACEKKQQEINARYEEEQRELKRVEEERAAKNQAVRAEYTQWLVGLSNSFWLKEYFSSAGSTIDGQCQIVMGTEKEDKILDEFCSILFDLLPQLGVIPVAAYSISEVGYVSAGTLTDLLRDWYPEYRRALVGTSISFRDTHAGYFFDPIKVKGICGLAIIRQQISSICKDSYLISMAIVRVDNHFVQVRSAISWPQLASELKIMSRLEIAKLLHDKLVELTAHPADRKKAAKS